MTHNAKKCDRAIEAMEARGYVFDDARGWHPRPVNYTEAWLNHLRDRRHDADCEEWLPKPGTIGEYAFELGKIATSHIDLRDDEIEVFAGTSEGSSDGLLFLWKKERKHPLGSHFQELAKDVLYIAIDTLQTLDRLQAAIDSVRHHIVAATTEQAA